MNKLIIDDGTQEIEINNDKNRKIRFCPTDPNIAIRYQELEEFFNNVEEKLEEMQGNNKDIKNQMQLLKELDLQVKEKVDYIFNGKISEVIFGNTSCFARGVNDKPIFQNMIEGLLKISSNAYKSKIKKSDKAKKYLNKYKR